jgi:hypothetical protein
MQIGSIAQLVLGVLMLLSLVVIINEALDPKSKLSRTSRLIRIIGGGLWFVILLAGIALQVSERLK